MANKLDLNALRIAVEKPLDRACRRVAIELVEEKVEDAKQNFLKAFLDHPISQEIQAGEHADGSTLPDDARGNLFSFIGFEQGSEPIEELHNFLEEHITFSRNPTLDRANNRYLFNISIPSKNEIKAETPMPWGTASSWVYGIESGIQGLNHYLSIWKANAYEHATGRKRDREEFQGSRSTTAIQSKRLVNKGIGQFKAQKYLTSLINDLKKSLQR